jgi:hypothetical protein
MAIIAAIERRHELRQLVARPGRATNHHGAWHLPAFYGRLQGFADPADLLGSLRIL